MEVNRKQMVTVSSLAVKADQQHGVQSVQRNTLILLRIGVTGKRAAHQSHFLRYHMGLRIGSAAAQLK